jgi:flavorubredoxin
MITNPGSKTRVDEVADGIYRISTPVDLVPGGFSFNQYLVVDEEPLLFHTGPRRMFPLVREAVAAVLPVERLRHVGFSHFEADECGSLNEFLAVAPLASPLCGQIAAMVSVNDVADRPPRALADGELLVLGRHRVRWLDTPHVPHAWECGFLFEETSRTLLCGDLFTSLAPRIRPSPAATSWGRARRCGLAWTTGRTRRARGRRWSGWLRFSRPRSRACTGPHGRGMGRG